MGQWLVQWTPIGDHCIVFVLSWCLSSPRCINGYCYRRGGRRCSGSNLDRCPFICLFIYLFIYFSHSFPMHWSHLKLPLKGPSQPHLSCFCLHTRVWLLYFIQSISKQTKSLWNYWIYILSGTYFQEHNLINKILLHHTISTILMASKIAEAD